MNISGLMNTARKFASDNSPTILTVAATTGVAATALASITATFKAAETLENERKSRELHEIKQPEPDAKEKIRLVWKHYIPPVVIAGTTMACVIGSNTVSSRRNAALATAVTLTEKAFGDYREKVIEQIGATKEETVREEVVKKQLEENAPLNREIVIVGTQVLCYETLTGRTFASDMETIRKAENDINRQINQDMYASLNEFWEKLGLSHTSMGEELGWNLDAPLEVVFTSVIEDGKPCLAVGYRVVPIREYHKVF